MRSLIINHTRIAIIICYFGKMPWYFKYFSKSCEYNPSVDFLLFTDNDITESIPPNIIVIRKTLADIANLASQKLTFPVSLTNPYKLNDFKPAYGFLFSEYLKQYHFWGQGDLDLVFGNIRSFITEEVLTEHDIISAKKEHIAGFFTLFKNTEVVNLLFMESKDFETVFRSSRFYCFDECNWQSNALIMGKSIFQVPAEIQCITYVVKRMHLCGKVKARFETIAREGVAGNVSWNRGELFYGDSQPYMLYHFVHFKELDYFFVPKFKEIPDRFFIRSFFVTKYSPDSLKGRIEESILRSKRFSKKWTTVFSQYRSWLLKYKSATKIVFPGEGWKIESLLGDYTDVHNHSAIRIVCKNGQLFVKSGQQAVIPLLQIENFTFLVGKFQVMDGMNIELEFRLNSITNSVDLFVKPFRHEKIVFSKPDTSPINN